ncbi:thiosulfate/3-mercaptopyruvate sulfurtransferase [Winogradskyella wandonensis]|uniref:Thiosulfate/3-mercaptopyruvate sulfurtransferase n=1 Tax=Winogradskyella wandonensis TaxID=1442586 RepID=A0A4R1KXC7_9FLAO|nr:sulfurtransferase [Winogradskyella wandonensis]TCK69260.1 thiosulfate/3-mercaptopyruvate sulfurtransferase [Winogradskyella wandonensis]
MKGINLNSSLVSVEWLNANIEAENLVVLDATIPKVSGSGVENTIGYIPKSRFFDIKNKFSAVDAQFPNTIPSKNQFQTEARNLGVNSSSCIVIYDQHGIYSSARAWWLFRYFGHKNVAVLNGGLPEWHKMGFLTVKHYSDATDKGDFNPKLNASLFTDFNGVSNFSKCADVQIIDARPKKRFSGEIPEPRAGLRSGTIPNSVNLPYTELLDGHKLKSKKELKGLFNSISDKNKTLVFSCGSGITACNLALGATIADYNDIVVYDGSWTEYGTLTEQ